MCVIAIQCDLRLVAQSCLTLCDPMDCSPPCSSVHGDSSGKNIGVDCHTLLQGIFPTQNLTQVSCIAGRFFTIWATRGDYQHTSIRKEPGYTTLRLWIPAFIYDIESSYLNRDSFIMISRMLFILSVIPNIFNFQNVEECYERNKYVSFCK